MHAWMARMGLPTGGRNYKLVSEQAKRISACRLTFFTDLGDGVEARHNGAFVQDAITLSGVSGSSQGSLWQDRVKLDEGFWHSLREHPIRKKKPVANRAIASCLSPIPNLRRSRNGTEIIRQTFIAYQIVNAWG